jgi:hypothetical protein
VAAPAALPAARLVAEDFLGSLTKDDLVYFLLNVGDGDAQAVLLPESEFQRDDGTTERRPRSLIVVDSARVGKMPALVDALVAAGLLPAANPTALPNGSVVPDGSIPLVVATHPHGDHIGGLPELLRLHRGRIAEFWDPGYWHPIDTYHSMMAEIEASPNLTYAQPTSGLRRWIGNALVTVLSPSVLLRNRFDTYGTEINDSSLSLRVEFPAARVIQRDDHRALVDEPNTVSLILGADAQTLSWSFVLTDFPQMHPSDSAAAKAIGAALGRDPLRANVLKVSHHASKHGVNLELVERVDPKFTLVSSVGGGGKYNFPHTVAQELIREALQPTTSSGAARKPDVELGVFHTCDKDDQGQRLGSIAAVLRPGRQRLWRFGDDVSAAVVFANARRWT